MSAGLAHAVAHAGVEGMWCLGHGLGLGDVDAKQGTADEDE